MELNKSLKSEIKPAYNLKGEDLFLIQTAIKNLKSTLVTDLEEFNYIKLNGEKLKSDELLSQIATLPINSEHRMIVVDCPSNEIIKFLNKYEFIDNSSVVVCINADKLENAENVDCSHIERGDISKYVLNYLKKYNISIQEQALDYIIDATGGDMSKIHNELEKLSSYACDSNIIDLDMATNLVANSTEYAIFMLTSAIDEKNLTKFQTILSSMSKSISLSDIFSYMGKYFRRMQYIAMSKNDEELAKILNIKPYAIKISRDYIRKNGINYYINLYKKYIDLDQDIKSGKITLTNAMYKLVF